MKTRIQTLTTREAWAACSVVRASIAECCFPDHRGDPQVMHMWLANKTPENFEAWFAAPQAIPLGAFDGGTAEAFYLRNGFQPSGPVKLWAGMQALPMSKHMGKALGDSHPGQTRICHM